MNPIDYKYELRLGEEIVANGAPVSRQALAVGERLTIGSREGTVRTIEPLLGERELRLVVQLMREGS